MLRGIVRKILKGVLRLIINENDLWWYVGENTARPHVYTHTVEGEGKLVVGQGVQLTNGIINVRSGNVSIGDFSFLGYNVMILTGRHDYTKIRQDRVLSVPSEGFNIVIGKGVWISSGAIILAPTIIGDDSVVAAGSIVKGIFPSNSFIAGNPATVKRAIFVLSDEGA